MNKLLTLINRLESKIPELDKKNESVSQNGVGWHIQHSILVVQRIISAVEGSNPASYTRTFNFSRTLVFTLNKIPRGRGKAPKSVVPTGIFTAESLFTEVQQLKIRINVLDTLNSNQYFEHPYFGKLNLKATRKFLEIHTLHHLAIMDDIIAAV